MSLHCAPWYQLRDNTQLETPALLTYPHRIEQNIRHMLKVIGDPDRLMPHLKTTKMAPVVRLLLQHGVRRFKCATIMEAQMLAEAGAPQVLVAYPMVGPSMERLLKLCATFPAVAFGVLVGSSIEAHQLSRAAQIRELTLSVWLDLNAGMNRTGFPIEENVLDIYAELASLPGLHCRGLHLYEGHIRDTDTVVRNARLRESLEQLNGWYEQLSRTGFEPVERLVGGTPGFQFYAQQSSLVCSPGHALLYDAGYAEQFPDLPFQCATLVMTRVVAKPAPNLLTVDLGFKAIASQYPIDQRVRFLNLPEARVVRHNEEHLVLETSQNQNVQVGYILYAVPYHIGGTVNLYDTTYTINPSGEVADVWPIARQRCASHINDVSQDIRFYRK